mmetsp:Transcript_63036/g.195169  ORF Transcript_63036/g.195169 Transcript_63036/m.195169 type:complete len:154 (-) Transcript_63036:343-804(-)
MLAARWWSATSAARYRLRRSYMFRSAILVATCDLQVVVDIELGSSMVTFHIRDEGGGMSPSALQSAWKFMHTTCKALRDGGGLGTSGGAMAGFGVGLPTARLFARHFGGDLQLSSQEGVGTEARIIVNTCGGCRLGPLAGMGLQVPTGEGTDR